MIKLSNITKIYNGDVCALDDVNLEFYEKEFVFIIGPSGNGKSTLLNIIGCLDFATTGEVIVNGEDVSKLTDKQLSFLRNSYFGFIFQEFYFDRNLNVLENVLVDFEKNAYLLRCSLFISVRDIAIPLDYTMSWNEKKFL